MRSIIAFLFSLALTIACSADHVTVERIPSTGGGWDGESFSLPSSAPLSAKGFGTIANGNVGYGTGANVIGPKTAAEYPPSGCPASTLCAMVSATNLSDQTMENMWTEVTHITPGWGVANSDTAPTGYVPPLDLSIGGWNYGTLAPLATATRDWHFSMGPGSFTFGIAALATFPRTSYSIGASETATFVDACTVSGHTELTGTTPAQLPFPVTVYGVTNTTATIGENGIIGLGSFGSTTNNNGGFTGSHAWNSSIAPFWDAISLVSGSSLCYATEGVSESRTFTVTWKNVMQGTLATNGPVSFSLVITERSDVVTFYYGALYGGKKSHGSSASIGVRGTTSSEVAAVGDNAGVAVVSSNSRIVITPSTDPAAK